MRYASLLLFAVVSAAAQNIVVYHEVATVEVGTSREFSAYVPLSPNTIRWTVNGIPGGNTTVGTVTGSGLRVTYNAPAVAPANNLITLTATSTAYPTKSGSSKITVVRKIPRIWSAQPSSFAMGAFQVRLNGANFTRDAIAMLDGVPVTAAYVSATDLRISGNAPKAGASKITVRLPAPGGVTSDPLNVTVTTAAPQPVQVTVSPSAASVQTGQQRAFAAAVTGTANTAVTWSVNGVTGGNAQSGTISTDGVYSAPTTVPSPATVTVRATSQQSNTAVGSASVTITSPQPVQVTVSPSTASVQTGQQRAFTATVTGSANTAVVWSVNGVTGGNPQLGTISAGGIYTAPATAPSPAVVSVAATSQQSSTASGSASVTIAAPTTPPPVITSVTPTSVTTGTPFTLTITGTGFVSGARVRMGSQELAATFVSATQLMASATSTAAAGSQLAVTVVNPDNAASNSLNLQVSGPQSGVSYLSAARLLDQAAFGPTPASIARVQQLGLDAWLQEQFSLPETAIPTTFPGSDARSWLVSNYAHANDQLRQRMAYSLGQILVVSRDKLPYAEELTPWMSLLSRHAFGNYRALLRELTILPSMGKYLDLANSTKPGVGGGANENYPRELLQLFSIGLWKLDRDGTQQPIPTYDQNTVRQVALALTGWTYPTAPGQQPRSQNWEYFVGLMEPRQENHDLSAKSFLGCTLPAGQSVTQDLDGVIDCVFNHPNVPPFVATRLIRAMVTSNPSPGYIDRVARVFENNGAQVRGDLKAVVRAILTDAEARQDVAAAEQGRLREPLLQVIAFGRALNAQISPTNQFTYVFDNMAQSVLAPPSVFNWFSPLYRIPRTTRFGPEFQIYTPSQSVERANFLYQILTQNFQDFRVDLSPYNSLAGNPAQLIDSVDRTLLYGRMPPAMRDSLSRAIAAASDNQQRVFTALYLTALSGYYAVQF